ncbi:leucine-rich repeat-containing protein 43-like [Eucyclogobius newberryi]|uniref:leucine-rich repeat-containing protein 43-like n=1 Tax=Eucyclogobius newberryi TaxID=166745 RepID=UPI003B5B14CC
MAVSVSAVLEELIHTLGLWEFPCGPGPWKQSAAEDTQALLDLLDCPASPWHQEPDWSPQAAALRRRAVLSLKRLSKSTVYQHFTSLRLMDKGVSVLDGRLLKLSNLERLVLSANQLQEVPAPLLPRSLKELELRKNRLTSLCSLTSGPPPRLLYLGLAANPLGSPLDVCSLTGAHWPELLCLDLSSCDFEEQRVLLGVLSSLPCLRSLLLEGNPCALGSLYPGLTLDALPQLSHLDSEWVRPGARKAFRGMAVLTGAEPERARVTVHVGRLRGLPEPPRSSDYPLLAFSYHVSYLFLPGSALDLQNPEEKNPEEKNPEEKNPQEPESLREGPGVCGVCSGTQGSTHSSSKLPWSECMDFCQTHHHSVSDLRALKSFLSRGMCVRVEEEKILSWPAASQNVTKEAKRAKGRYYKQVIVWATAFVLQPYQPHILGLFQTPNKAASTKGNTKNQKKRAPEELVQDLPIRRVLGSVHVPLHSLLLRGHKVALCCDFGLQGSEAPPANTMEKRGSAHTQDVGKKAKEDLRRGSSGKKTTTAKGKAKLLKEVDEASKWGPQEPLTVELCVQLDHWRSAAEASEELGLAL